MRILVTGGNGFLGRRLVPRLAAAGHDVRCLIRSNFDRAALGDVDVVEGTLSQRAVVHHALCGCDIVIHAAAAMRGGVSVLFANNVTATRQLIELAQQSGVKRFVQISSMGVYGTHQMRDGQVLDETCPLDSQAHLRDPYTYSKIEQERVAWEARARSEFPLVVIRPGVIYGPGRDCMSSRVGLRIGDFLLAMGGRRQLPYTYVDNCADAIALAAVVPGIEGEALNIVDDDPPAAMDFLNRYRKVRPLRTLTVPHSAVEPVSRFFEWYHRHSRGQIPNVLTRYKSQAMWKRLTYSNAKAKSLLGWSPRVSFSTGLGQTFAAMNGASN